MLRLLFAIPLALMPAMTCAQSLTGTEWQLLAIDGNVVEMTATLRAEANGSVAGKAPCNRWTTMNTTALPEFRPKAIAATRMACDRLDDEQVFLEVLAVMDHMALEAGHLVLRGPNARSMEFVIDRTALDGCRTCPPIE